VLLAFGSRFYFDKKVNDLTEEVTQKQVQIETFADTEKQMRRILAKQAPIDSYLVNNITFSQRYDELTKIIPSGVRLEKLTIDINGMGMTGDSTSELGFAQLLRSLKRMDGVANLSMKETSFDQTSGSVKFNIQATFK
jgi:Tfp pilus assembly protein PilN